MISHHLKWGPLPPNEVSKIIQHVRKGKKGQGRTRIYFYCHIALTKGRLSRVSHRLGRELFRPITYIYATIPVTYSISSLTSTLLLPPLATSSPLSSTADFSHNPTYLTLNHFYLLLLLNHLQS